MQRSFHSLFNTFFIQLAAVNKILNFCFSLSVYILQFIDPYIISLSPPTDIWHCPSDQRLVFTGSDVSALFVTRRQWQLVLEEGLRGHFLSRTHFLLSSSVPRPIVTIHHNTWQHKLQRPNGIDKIQNNLNENEDGCTDWSLSQHCRTPVLSVFLSSKPGWYELSKLAGHKYLFFFISGIVEI